MPVREGFTDELEELRIQVEVMALRVDANLTRMREVLDTGDEDLAREAVAADDEIDAMDLSLTERCYDLLTLESPVAGDLRLVVSIVRMLSELERVGDLSLRVVKLAPEHDVLLVDEEIHGLVVSLADAAVNTFHRALDSWARRDLDLATVIVEQGTPWSETVDQIVAALLRLEGPDAGRRAVRTMQAVQSLDRIADHGRVIAARIRYLLTGDPAHLATEVR